MVKVKYQEVIVFLRILKIQILLRHVRLLGLIIWQLLHSHPSCFPQQETAVLSYPTPSKCTTKLSTEGSQGGFSIHTWMNVLKIDSHGLGIHN